MLTRLVDFVVGREPVATATGIAGVVTAALGVVAALGVDIDPELVAAVGTLVAALAGWLARKAVTPVRKPLSPPPLGYVPEKPGSSQYSGSVPLALVILLGLAVVLMAGLAVCSDAAFEDEDEVNDLGAPAWIADHEYDDWDGGSDGNRGYDGEGGQSGDTDQRGNENCRNLCGNTIIVPDPRGDDRRGDAG